MNPLVSVCVITFNHEKYIEDCLIGILNQKVDFSIEVLIHDDASTDGTAEIVRKYSRQYPTIIREPIIQESNQFSKGVRGFNPRFNFPRASGKYIALCEGDDYWTDSRKLQKQVDFLEHHHDYILVHHDADIVDTSGTLIKKSKLPESNKRDFTGLELKKGPFLLTLSLCFRNEIKGEAIELFRTNNGDKVLISLLGNYGKGKYMQNIGNAVYRSHIGGIWSRISENKKDLSLKETFRTLALYYINDKDVYGHYHDSYKWKSIKTLSFAFKKGKWKNKLVGFLGLLKDPILKPKDRFYVFSKSIYISVFRK